MFGLLRKTVKLGLGTLGLGLVVVGIPWGVSQLGSMSRVYHSPSEAPSRDVTMVMGAATIGGRPSPYLRARLDVALELYHSGKTKVIIVSGSTSDDEPAVMRKYLTQNGVAELDVVLDEGGDDSYRSCARAKEKFGVNEIAVVSQDYHLPRTVTTCRLVGIDAIGVADTSRERSGQYYSYVVRELGANVKMIFDVLTRPDPGISEPSLAVRDALARRR